MSKAATQTKAKPGHSVSNGKKARIADSLGGEIAGQLRAKGIPVVAIATGNGSATMAGRERCGDQREPERLVVSHAANRG
jgi:hypothetical protein